MDSSGTSESNFVLASVENFGTSWDRDELGVLWSQLTGVMKLIAVPSICVTVTSDKKMSACKLMHQLFDRNMKYYLGKHCFNVSLIFIFSCSVSFFFKKKKWMNHKYIKLLRIIFEPHNLLSFFFLLLFLILSLKTLIPCNSRNFSTCHFCPMDSLFDSIIHCNSEFCVLFQTFSLLFCT